MVVAKLRGQENHRVAWQPGQTTQRNDKRKDSQRFPWQQDGRRYTIIRSRYDRTDFWRVHSHWQEANAKLKIPVSSFVFSSVNELKKISKLSFGSKIQDILRGLLGENSAKCNVTRWHRGIIWFCSSVGTTLIASFKVPTFSSCHFMTILRPVYTKR